MALRCPTVVGRAPELARLEALLGVVAAGGGGAVALLGEPGIGKTRLSLEVSSHAADRGFIVLRGQATGTGGNSALRPILEVAAEASRLWPELPVPVLPYQAVLARTCPAWGDPAPGEVPTVVVADALLRLIACSTRRCLVVLEDLHWADPDTLQVVEYLVDHADSTGTGVVLTARPQPPAAGALVSSLAARGGVEVLDLGRLTEGHSAEIARRCLVSEALDDSIAALVVPADGLPLLVEDLLGDARASGFLRRERGVWRCEQPTGGPAPSFVASVRGRVQALGDLGSRVLGAAAVVGTPFEAAWAGVLAGVMDPELSRVLADAVAAQLLGVDQGRGRFDFRHALTREAVLGELPATLRRELTEQAALRWDRMGLPADRGAELFAAAGRADDAAVLLLAAARSERERGTREAALRMLAGAHELATEPTLSRQATVAYLSALAEVGRVEQATALAVQVLPFLPAAEATDVRIAIATAALAAEQPDRARVQVDLATASSTLTEVQWARVWALRAGIALGSTEPGRVVQAEHLAHRAVAAARAATDPGALCDALSVLGRCARLRDLDQAEEAFTAARDTAQAHGLPLVRLQALAELGTIQMLREVRADLLEAAYEAAVALGALVTAAGIGVNLAGLAVMRGELDEAIRIARRSQDAARSYGLTGALPMAVVFEGIARGFQGAADDMERLLSTAAVMAPDSPDVHAAAWAIGRATTALLNEDRARAHHALTRAEGILRASPALMIDPAAGPLVLLGCVEGQVDIARIDDAERCSGTGSAWTSMWVDAARAVHAGANGDDPAPHLSVARAAARRYPIFGLVARRLTAEASLRDGWGDPGEPIDLELLAAHRGYAPVASACRALARRAGVRVPRRRAVDAALPDALVRLGITAREAEVLELMPQRLTNAQMAQRLYLSPRTVEKHVAGLVAKTGAADRAALAAVAEDLARPSPDRPATP